MASLLQSLMKYGGRRYKIYHLSLNLLLQYLAKFECSNMHLYNSYLVQR